MADRKPSPRKIYGSRPVLLREMPFLTREGTTREYFHSFPDKGKGLEPNGGNI